MRLFYWCVFTCSRLYTQNDTCYTRILSQPVPSVQIVESGAITSHRSPLSERLAQAILVILLSFIFFYQQQKFKLTVPLTQKDLRTPQAKAVQFRCCIGICKNKSFYVLHGYNNLYAPNLYLYLMEKSLIRKR